MRTSSLRGLNPFIVSLILKHYYYYYLIILMVRLNIRIVSHQFRTDLVSSCHVL